MTSRSWRSASGISTPSGCARHLEHQFSAPAKAIQVSQHRGSRELGERAFARRAQHREPDLSHETKLQDLEVVKDVHRDTALVTCLKEQRPTGEAGHVPPREGRRGRVGHIKLPFGCKVAACAGRLLREEDTGKLGAATRCNRDPQTSRYRLRNKDEDSAEPQCERAPLASTPREPKEPARGRICITRQAGCNISHVSHLREDSPAHRQRVSEASKGLQLTLQTSELVSVKQRKDQLRDVGGKVIMCLNDRRPRRRASGRWLSGVPSLTASSSRSRYGTRST